MAAIVVGVVWLTLCVAGVGWVTCRRLEVVARREWAETRTDIREATDKVHLVIDKRLDAMSAIANQLAGQGGASVDEALAPIRHTLEGMDQRIGQLVPRLGDLEITTAEALQDVRQDVKALDRQVDQLIARLEASPEDPKALDVLAKAIETLTTPLVAPAPAPAAGPSPEDIERQVGAYLAEQKDWTDGLVFNPQVREDVGRLEPGMPIPGIGTTEQQEEWLREWEGSEERGQGVTLEEYVGEKVVDQIPMSELTDEVLMDEEAQVRAWVEPHGV